MIVCLLLIFLSFLGGSFSQNPHEVNWCDVETRYCPSGTSHLACNGESFPSGRCEGLEVIEMTARMKKLLLLRHNYYRNLVAGGLLEDKPPAAKMMQIHWNDTLQFLAEKHVAHCNFAHDGCRATDLWRIVGQNIALFESSVDDTDVDVHLAAAVDLWFAEHLEATVNAALQADETTGHFLTMVLEGNHRMGCSMARYRTLKDAEIRYNYLVTCDYSAGLVIDEDTYTEGPSCSLCYTIGARLSSIYDSLCDDADEFPVDESLVYYETLEFPSGEEDEGKYQVLANEIAMKSSVERTISPSSLVFLTIAALLLNPPQGIN